MMPRGGIAWLNVALGGALLLFLVYQGLGALGPAVSRAAAPSAPVRVVAPKPPAGPAADRRADRTDRRRVDPTPSASATGPAGPAVLVGADGQPFRD
jgi:hypothetical protein